MMLIMVLWQCLFVAVEAGASVAPAADIHHQTAGSADLHLSHPHPDIARLDTARLNTAYISHHPFDATDRHSSADSGDSCDHCCACQGHGTHLSIHIQGFSLALTAPGFLLVVAPQQLPSLYPPSIYRPPIHGSSGKHS